MLEAPKVAAKQAIPRADQSAVRILMWYGCFIFSSTAFIFVIFDFVKVHSKYQHTVNNHDAWNVPYACFRR